MRAAIEAHNNRSESHDEDSLDGLLGTSDLQQVSSGRSELVGGRSMKEELQLLTAEDVARLLGKHPRTILAMAGTGELPAVRLGHRTVRFLQSDVEDYIDRHRTGVAS
jgi:excisionase family DNA binding protein